MTVHMRSHDVGGERPMMRVWYDNMAAYGQFNVVAYSDIQAFVDAGMKMGVGTYIVHTCDGMTPCKCHQLSYGEQIVTWVD